MTALLVIDTSAILKLVLDEAHADDMLGLLATLPERGARLTAPTLLAYEATNVLYCKAWEPGREEELKASLGWLLDQVDLQAFTPMDMREVGLRAHASGLSAYDASYVHLAERLEAPLITYDKAIAGGEHACPVRTPAEQLAVW